MRVVGYLNYLDNIWECFSISYLEIFEDGTQLGVAREYKYQDEQAAMRWLEAKPGQLSGTTEQDGQRDGHPPCLQVP